MTVHRAYLQCLLEADNLRSEHGIHAIPHGCTQSVYSDLLKGVQPSPVTKAPRFTLEDDLPQTQLLSQDPQAEDDRLGTLAIDDDDYSPTEYGEDSANRMLDLIFEDNMHDDSKVVDRASDPGESQMLRVLQDGSSELEKPVARAEADMGPCQSEPADTERRKIVAMSVNEASTAGYDWRSFKWGAFRFTSKRPSKIGSDGQGSFVWQASCPFHAKNQKTGCRKSCNVSPLTPENFRNVINCLKAWCNEARKCRTQAEHIALSVSPGSFPLPSVIEAACIPESEKPSSKVKTDVEIFDEQAKDTAQPSAPVSGPSLPGPKRSAKSAPKRKAKAKPKARVDDKDSSSSSSSKQKRDSNSSTSDSDSSNSSEDNSNSSSSS